MKTNLYIVNIKESRIISGLLSIVFILSMVTGLQVSMTGYMMVLFLFVMSKCEPVEAVQGGAALGLETKDLFILKRVFMFNNENFHKRLYYFNRFGTFMILAGVILHDVLVYLKIIDPV